MEENILLIIPEDCPEFKSFNLPTLGGRQIFERMWEAVQIKTPTIAKMSNDEVAFILDNRVYFDIPMYMVEHLPDYDFTPKWITFLTQFETVSFDALSQLIGAYQHDKAEERDVIDKPGAHVVPIADNGQGDEEDEEIDIIKPEIL